MEWNGITYFYWKEPTSLSAFPPQGWLLRALSKFLLHTDRLGASTTSLGSLFQSFARFSTRKWFLNPFQSSPDAALSHSHVSCHWIPGRRVQSFPLHSPSSGSCREQWGHPPAYLDWTNWTDRTNWTNPKSLAAPSQDIHSSPFSSFVPLLWIYLTSFLNCRAQTKYAVIVAPWQCRLCFLTESPCLLQLSM